MKTQRINLIYVIGSAIGLILLFLIPIQYMDQLPDRIPMHYGADGVVDRYGKKTGLWTLPVIGSVMFAIMAILGHYLPSLPQDPKKKNAPEVHQQQLVLSVHLVGLLNITITWIFAYLAYRTVRIATGNAVSLGAAFLPISIAVILLPMIYIFWRMIQVTRQ